MRGGICRRAFLSILLVAVAATAQETENAAPTQAEESPATAAALTELYQVPEVAPESEDQSNAVTATRPVPIILPIQPDYNYQPESKTIQKRSISNIIKLLLGGNVPPNHPLVKTPDIEQKTWSLASNIASSLAGGGNYGWGPSAANQISHLFATKAKILPYTGQVASGLTGIASVKGDILRQIHSLSTAVIAQAAAEAAAKAVASAAAAHAVTAGVANGIHQTKYAVNKAVKQAKAQTHAGIHRPHFGGGGGGGPGWNNYQQAYYSTFQNSYAPAPSPKSPGDLPGPPYGGGDDRNAVAASQGSQYNSNGLNGYLNSAASSFSQSHIAPSAPSSSQSYFPFQQQQQQQQPQQTQAYDLYSSFNNNNNKGASLENPQSRSEQPYGTLPSSYQQQGDDSQSSQQWNANSVLSGLFGGQPQGQQNKPGGSIFNSFQGGFPLGSTKVQASAGVSGRNAAESPPSILTSLATLLSASASAYQAINTFGDAPVSTGVPNDSTARQDSSAVPTAPASSATSAAATAGFQGFPTSSAYQQRQAAASGTASAANFPGGFPQGVSSTGYQPGRSSAQSQSQAQGSSFSASSAAPTYAMAPQFAPSNFNQQTRPASFNSPSAAFGSRPQSSGSYQHNAQAPRDSHYAESVSRTQNGYPSNSGGFQQQQSNNGQRYSGYPRGTGSGFGHAGGSGSFPTNYWGNGFSGPSSRNFQTGGSGGNPSEASGNFASPSGAFGAPQQSVSKQIYGFGGQTPQNFAQPGAQRNYQPSPIQGYPAQGRPNQGYGGHTNQPLNSFINSRYDFIAQSASPNQMSRRYELPSQPTQNQFNSHQQYNNNGGNNNRMPMFSSKPGGGFTIPMTNGPVSFTLTIPNNGRPATILQERKGQFTPTSAKDPEQLPSSEEGGNAGEVSSSAGTASLERRQSNSWEETGGDKKSIHNNKKEKIDYIYSKEVSESHESVFNSKRKEQNEASREINMRTSHEATPFLPKKTPRLSPDDLRSLLVDEEESESLGRVSQGSSDVSSLLDEEPVKKVSSSANKAPKKDWDTLRREARAKSLSALVQRLMGVQD